MAAESEEEEKSVCIYDSTSSGYHSAASACCSANPSPPNPQSPNIDVKSVALLKYVQRQRDAPTECAVCGDPSTCYHYDVASCNGCKTFFRRTVVYGKNYQCSSGGRCEIRNGNCRRCRSCRFDQCLRAGMNPLAINLPPNDDTRQTLSALQKRKHRIFGVDAEEDEQMDVFDSAAPSTSAAVCTAVAPKRPITQSLAERPTRRLDFLVYLELHCNEIRENSASTPLGLLKTHLSDLMRRKPDLRAAITQQPRAIDHKPSDSGMRTKRIQEMGRSVNWMLVDTWLCLDAAKTLPVMEKLQFEDQMALIKHIALVNVTVTQVFYTLRKNCTTITHPDGVMPIKFGACTNLENEIFTRVTEPFMRIGPTLEEYVLLKAIIWCHPAAPGLSDEAQKILENERQEYTQDLFQCCCRQYGPSVGAKKFGELLAVIDAFFHFTQKHREHIVLILTLYHKKWDRVSWGQFIEDMLFGEKE